MRTPALVIVLALALLGTACSAVPTSANAPAAQSGKEPGEQKSEAGSVTIVATWLPGGVPVARVVMDTHSVDLDRFDLASLARLRLDAGGWIAPTGWDAPPGGHHRVGTLSFATLDRQNFEAARTVELEIADVAVPSRVLRWERAS